MWTYAHHLKVCHKWFQLYELNLNFLKLFLLICMFVEYKKAELEQYPGLQRAWRPGVLDLKGNLGKSRVNSNIDTL